MTDRLYPAERIRISQRARDHLVTLKRRTGIRQWNVLCRWAFCRSLAEPSVPSAADTPADSSVEMTWQVFGGNNADVYAALLRYRCVLDSLGTQPETLNAQFRLHLHRGIGYLVADRTVRNIESLFAIVLR